MIGNYYNKDEQENGLNYSEVPSNIIQKTDSTQNSGEKIDETYWHGVIALLFCSFLFGTLHVPIRRFNQGGNGLFIQWIMSIGILLVGFCINITQNSPRIEYLAVFGGMIWAIANSIAQHVISVLGLAVALLLWNTTNCLTGWFTGRFGLFGLKKVIPQNELLNIIGLLILLIGGISFIFVKKTQLASSSNIYPMLHSEASILPHSLPTTPTTTTTTTDRYNNRRLKFSFPFFDLKTIENFKHSLKQKILRNYKRISCVFLALLSGFFYGLAVVPVIYMQNNPEIFPNSSRTPLPYIFSHYFGVFICSSIIFVIYAIIMRNKPSVNASIILPSLLGGVIWAIGMILLFISIDTLKQVITYPISTTLPGCVAIIWSIFYFKEINSRRNYFIIVGAFLFIIVGTILVFLSRIKM